MFTKKTDPKSDLLQEAIDSALNDLKGYHANDDEHATVVDQLVKLKSLQDEQKLHWKNIDPNTLVVTGVNLLGIVAILKHEKFEVITTKALGFVMKSK